MLNPPFQFSPFMGSGLTYLTPHRSVLWETPPSVPSAIITCHEVQVYSSGDKFGGGAGMAKRVKKKNYASWWSTSFMENFQVSKAFWWHIVQWSLNFLKMHLLLCLLWILVSPYPCVVVGLWEFFIVIWCISEITLEKKALRLFSIQKKAIQLKHFTDKIYEWAPQPWKDAQHHFLISLEKCKFK